MTPQEREAMQNALNVLSASRTYPLSTKMAIEALSTALAQPESYPDDFINAFKYHTALAQPEPAPIAYFDPQEKGFYWAHPTKINAPVSVKVEPLALYAAPPKSECSCAECGKKASDGWALYCVDCGEILATAIAEETKKREKNT